MKKGFTLIELLAVIVILAVIVLIATPMILGVIETARKESVKSSAAGYVNAVEKQIIINQLDSNAVDIADGVYDLPMEGVSVKGERPSEGWIAIENGEIANYSMKVMDYVVTMGEEPTKEGTISDKPKNVVCKRATILHTEECTQVSTSQFCSGAGHTETGSKGTTAITYGNETVTDGVLTSGDAFDCDVNRDGEYNQETERFYYVSSYYNTTTKSFETDKAVLIYYSNTAVDNNGNIIPDNTDSIIYDNLSNGGQRSRLGPLKAVTNLPKIDDWINVRLFNTERAILTESGGSTSNGAQLPTDFDYSIYAARLLTYQELSVAKCGTNITNQSAFDNKCNYLMENTQYSTSSVQIRGYWLENPVSDDYYSAKTVDSLLRRVGSATSNSSYKGARPVIEVLKENIEY